MTEQGSAAPPVRPSAPLHKLAGPRPPRASDWPAAIAFEISSRALCLLPRSVVLPAARAIGRAFYHLLPGRREVALDNLRCAMPELDEPARRRLAKESFGHAAAIAADLLTLPRVSADVPSHCRAEPGSLEALEDARSRGRGVILVAGHYGLFESMGILLGHAGHPVHFVAKPFDNPLLDRAVARRRGATGNSTIHKGGAKNRAREILASGGTIAIVIDQHVTWRDRLWVPFFGIPAATSRSLGTLASETGAPIVPIHAHPEGAGGCLCSFGPVIDVKGGSDPEALVHATIREMEAATRRHPAAWLWLHRRWKVKPDGAPGYPAYAEDESSERRRAEARMAREAALGR